MAQDLYSPHWYRVADLHPKLRAQVRMQRQHMRGQPWYLLTDPSEGRHFRLNAGAYRFVGLCDGQRSVQEIWDLLTDTLGEAAPTQGEVVGILGRLAGAGLMQAEVSPDVESLFEDRERRQQSKTLAQLNPLAIRVPLLDPTAILQRLQPWTGWLFGKWFLPAWLLLILSAGVGALTDWKALATETSAVVQSPVLLLLIWMAYPLVKTVHEFAHALAVRHWGGEVNSMGITLLVLTPVPWVDASASTAFPYRHQRFLVGAAGILAEAGLAAVAYFVWSASQPGDLHEAMLAVMLIGGVSTVLFNGNPLLRFDGYHMLSDVLNIPNLAPRSEAYWGYLGKRFLLRLPAEAPATGQGERPWLLVYGLASYLYRIFISLLILYWMLGISRLLFLVAVLATLWVLLLKPLRTILRAIWQAPGSPAQQRRARWLGLGGVAATAGFLALIPLPHRSVAEGVVWLPENAHVRPQTEGFVRQIHVRDGERVQAGQLLLTLDDPLLFAERDRLLAQEEALRTKRFNALQATPGDAKSLADAMASLDEQIKRNAERIGHLRVRAGIDGMLVLPRQEDIPGRFAQRGDDLGYILPPGNVRVRAVIAQEDAELVRQRARAAQVWLHESLDGIEATLLPNSLAAASRKLPSIALGDWGGGAVITDAEDSKHLTAVEPFFLLDMEVPGEPLSRVGGRALVRLDLGAEPLLQQAWRRLRQVFLIPALAA